METKMLVKKYEYEKILKNEVELKIPSEPVFYAEYNHRDMVGLYPEFDDNNNVIGFDIIELSTSPNYQIKKIYLYVTKRHFEDLFLQDFQSENKADVTLLKKVVNLFIDKRMYDLVCQKTFEAKYNHILNSLNQIVIKK